MCMLAESKNTFVIMIVFCELCHHSNICAILTVTAGYIFSNHYFEN